MTTTTKADTDAWHRALETSGRFRRDSGLGAIYHRGKSSYRELTPVNSLHVIIDEDGISGHVDRISPLKFRRDGTAGYSPTRVVAHNLSGISHHLASLVRGRARERCDLRCDLSARSDVASAEAKASGRDGAPSDGRA